MAKTQGKNSKSTPSKIKNTEKKFTEETKTSFLSAKNIRTYIGGFFLLLGSFLLVAITSYFFTWKQDQANLLSSQSLFDFLFIDKSIVNNWSGRFGAAFSHLLIYSGVGISSIIFTIWLSLSGLKLMYPKRYFGLRKWRKLLAFSILFISPLLSFVFPNAAFPLGGALGNQLIEWTNGFAGTAGNILILIAVGCFFIFIVFQFDIKPWMKKAKSLVPESDRSDNNSSDTEKNNFKGYRHFTPEEEKAIAVEKNTSQNEMESGEAFTESPTLSGNRLKSEIIEELEITNEGNTEEMIISSARKKSGSIHLELPQEEEVPTLLPLNMEGIEKEIEEEFEITTVSDEAQIPKNGSHISIESQEPYDPSLDLPNFKFPTLDLLDEMENTNHISFNKEELEKNKNQIIHTLRSFGIEIQKIKATVGPTVTLYEIIPAEGVRISKIKNLEDDIALTLAALGIRIIAPIPGRGTIGIEVPNTEKQIVGMRTLLSSEKFINNTMSLPIALGKKIDNEHYIVDLATMPHLLMAGATGQGKSVGINAILVSLLYKKHPSQLKFVMVDPKKVELSIYRVIEKHYLAMLPNEEEPIITDVKKVIHTVNALCIEMDNRYELLKDAGARNIKEYNDKFIKRKLNPLQGHKYLPFIVLVIDEFADLIMTAGKEVEMPIARLAQLARAVGIHIIIATQRPSVNVITGIIKANFPARMAFKVSAKVDSRTILDAGGAEQLIGKGDMLVSHGSELIRLQCAFVDTPEVERIVNFIGEQRGYPSAFELPEYEGEDGEVEKEAVDLSKRDKNFEECARLVVSSQSGSTSMLQRRFNLGYNRAGRIMDQLEAAGIVGPQVGSKPRDLLVTTEYELENILQELG